MEKGSEPVNLKKYFFLLVVAILLILSYQITKHYLIPLVSAFILSYLIKPLHNRLSLKLNKKIAAIICIAIIILAIILPLAILANTLKNQVQSSLETGLQNSLEEKISSAKILKILNLDLGALKERLINLLISMAKSSISYLPSLILAVVITFLSIYHILINWDFLAEKIEQYIPLKNKKKIMKEIGTKTNGIVRGYILIALIEFAVSLIGFYISGVRYFLLFPLIISIFAFLPGLGPGLVWVPLAIYYLIIGDYLTGIGVIITGLIISIVIENFVYARIIGAKSEIHPLILLIGVFGGVPIFGLFGFIIGPIILVYTLKLVQEAINEYPQSFG